MTVFRTDVGRLDKFERTPSGGLRIPAAVARTGVQVYRDARGIEHRELRHPEDVFDPAALASFADAPVTDLHPEVIVDPSNWKDLAKGSVVRPRRDGSLVMVDLLVLDADEIRLIESGERKECSGGYTCELELVSGVYEGERYDARQRTIRANHVGLGPNGWGRAGAEVSLRLDGAMQDGWTRADEIEHQVRIEAGRVLLTRDNERWHRDAADRFAVRSDRADGWAVAREES